ncbi:MAG TPA: hypothetical protein VGI89_06120 [Rhizomicrobium sp.]
MALAYDFLSRMPHLASAKRADECMAECEFGPIGRDPRYPSGWFIVPALIVGAVILGFLL